MTRKTKLMKWLIIFIFAMFIVVTILAWIVPYFRITGDDSTWTGDNLTWVVVETWINLSWEKLNSIWSLITWESN